jgi:UDP-N-acetylmuramyl pentapeptide phosphotransferase/UDP-N-acetylglucosamine-1-phosphate transferase
MTSVATLVLAALCAALFSATVRRLPGPRAVPLPNRWHRTVTPATGGVALFGAFLLGLQPGLFSAAVDRGYLPLVLGTGAAFALGLWDDAASIGVRKKFAGQFVIAIAAAVAGVRPDWLPLWAGIPVACLILLASMNSLNLLDNMDGLAAGTAAIAALGLALVAGVVPGSGSSVVAAALAGACLGFLPFNYRPRRPAALFMGDSGSHMLGFALGGLALLASPGGAGGAAAAVAAPLLILALPVLDTGLVMLVRFSEGRPLWQGGRDHSSHRLVYSGMGERRAVAVLLGIAINCTATAIALVILQDFLLIAVAAGATLAALVAFASQLVVITERPGRLVELEPSGLHRMEGQDANVG